MSLELPATAAPHETPGPLRATKNLAEAIVAAAVRSGIPNPPQAAVLIGKMTDAAKRIGKNRPKDAAGLPVGMGKERTLDNHTTNVYDPGFQKDLAKYLIGLVGKHRHPAHKIERWIEEAEKIIKSNEFSRI